jgi:hypothetical protein
MRLAGPGPVPISAHTAHARAASSSSPVHSSLLIALFPSLDPRLFPLARATYLRRDDAQAEAVSVADSEAGLDVERD